MHVIIVLYYALPKWSYMGKEQQLTGMKQLIIGWTFSELCTISILAFFEGKALVYKIITFILPPKKIVYYSIQH